jgi:uncharacterized protein DUF3761
MTIRKLLTNAALVLIILLITNALQTTTVGAQCPVTWQSVLWPEESNCRPEPPAASVADPSTGSLAASTQAPKVVPSRPQDNDAGDNSSSDDNSDNSSNDNSDNSSSDNDDNSSSDNSHDNSSFDNSSFDNVLIAPTNTGVRPQSGPTAICRDGTLSYSADPSVACAGHGGINMWLK